MRSNNSMKSVIAQGSTISKAIEEALKKAGMPSEFFIKLLEDAQGGFLGFGAKKAKIALFFKQNHPNFKPIDLLSQDSFQNLFDNNELNKQIEHQLKGTGSTQPQKQQQPQQRPAQQRTQPKPMQHRTQPTAQQQGQTPIQAKSNNMPQPKQQEHRPQPQAAQPTQNNNASKLMVRPLPNKKNDSSKS
jgi:predicted RNA-binding protein Jag